MPVPPSPSTTTLKVPDPPDISYKRLSTAAEIRETSDLTHCGPYDRSRLLNINVCVPSGAAATDEPLEGVSANNATDGRLEEAGMLCSHV